MSKISNFVIKKAEEPEALPAEVELRPGNEYVAGHEDDVDMYVGEKCIAYLTMAKGYPALRIKEGELAAQGIELEVI